MNMHILITDDHAAVRRGLREMLSDLLPGATFFEASHADEAEALLSAHKISMLLLDINMPGRSGLELLPQVRREFPLLPIIMLSIKPENQYAERCLRAGATAYINKDDAAERLPQAISAAFGPRLDGGRMENRRFVDDGDI
jgi:two-component system, NarL family, invasion response regulator UvrY